MTGNCNLLRKNNLWDNLPCSKLTKGEPNPLLILFTALAMAFLVIGFLGACALVIRKLWVKNARIDKLSIGELEVDELLIRQRYEEVYEDGEEDEGESGEDDIPEEAGAQDIED